MIISPRSSGWITKALVSGRGDGESHKQSSTSTAASSAIMPGRRRRRGRDELGFSLIEVLVTLVILSVGVVALVSSLMNTIAISDIHRKDAVEATILRNYAESIKSAVLIACPQNPPSSPIPT